MRLVVPFLEKELDFLFLYVFYSLLQKRTLEKEIYKNQKTQFLDITFVSRTKPVMIDCLNVQLKKKSSVLMYTFTTVIDGKGFHQFKKKIHVKCKKKTHCLSMASVFSKGNQICPSRRFASLAMPPFSKYILVM